MLIPSKSLLCLFSIIILITSCQSNSKELKFNDKPISSIESKDGNLVFHFQDHSIQAFTEKQMKALLSKKEVSENLYQLCSQKLKEEKNRIKQSVFTNTSKPADKKHFSINGMNATSVEFKEGNFIFNLVDHTKKAFSQEEVDCLLYLSGITEETYLMCFQKQQEEELSNLKDASKLSFTYREVECKCCN